MAVRSKRHAAKPAREVEWNGKFYKVRGNVEIPDLLALPRFTALMWLNTHTYARGYSKPNPLAGFAGAIEVGTR